LFEVALNHLLLKLSGQVAFFVPEVSDGPLSFTALLLRFDTTFDLALYLKGVLLKQRKLLGHLCLFGS
jgi:hypothetical protein